MLGRGLALAISLATCTTSVSALEHRPKKEKLAAGVLDYLEIGTHIYETLADARPKAAGASVDMIHEYVEELEKRAKPNVGKIFLNAAITDVKNATDVDVYKFKPRYAEVSWRCRTLTKTSDSQCQCTKEDTNPVQQELRQLGIRIRTKTGCFNPWSLASHSVGAPFYENRKLVVAENMSQMEAAKLLSERRTVPMMTPGQLLKQLNISNVLSLKVDVEGFDAKVVKAFAEHMASKEGQAFRPTEFQWECKHLSLKDEKESVASIRPLGYQCKRLEFDCFCNRTTGGAEPSMRLTPSLGKPVHNKL